MRALGALGELDRLEDRVAVRLPAASRHELLHLPGGARPAGDDRREGGLDRIVGLAPVLLLGIPRAALLEPERVLDRGGEPLRLFSERRREERVATRMGAVRGGVPGSGETEVHGRRGR